VRHRDPDRTGTQHDEREGQVEEKQRHKGQHRHHLLEPRIQRPPADAD